MKKNEDPSVRMVAAVAGSGAPPAKRTGWEWQCLSCDQGRGAIIGGPDVRASALEMARAVTQHTDADHEGHTAEVRVRVHRWDGEYVTVTVREPPAFPRLTRWFSTLRNPFRRQGGNHRQ